MGGSGRIPRLRASLMTHERFDGRVSSFRMCNLDKKSPMSTPEMLILGDRTPQKAVEEGPQPLNQELFNKPPSGLNPIIQPLLRVHSTSIDLKKKQSPPRLASSLPCQVSARSPLLDLTSNRPPALVDQVQLNYPLRELKQPSTRSMDSRSPWYLTIPHKR